MKEKLHFWAHTAWKTRAEKKKNIFHPSSQAPAQAWARSPGAQARAPAKKDGKFKFTARKFQKNPEEIMQKMKEKLHFSVAELKM